MKKKNEKNMIKYIIIKKLEFLKLLSFFFFKKK